MRVFWHRERYTLPELDFLFEPDLHRGHRR
jgi:hypothetical protein